MSGSSEKRPSIPVSPTSATSAKRVRPSASPDQHSASASWSPSPSKSESSSTPHMIAYLTATHPRVDPKVVETIGLGCKGNLLEALALLGVENDATGQGPHLPSDFEGVVDSEMGPQPEEHTSPLDKWINKILQAKDRAEIEEILIEMLSEGDDILKEVIRALKAKVNSVRCSHKKLLETLSEAKIKSKKLEEELKKAQFEIENEIAQKSSMKAMYEDQKQYLIAKVEQGKLLMEEEKKKYTEEKAHFAALQDLARKKLISDYGTEKHRLLTKIDILTWHLNTALAPNKPFPGIHKDGF